VKLYFAYKENLLNGVNQSPMARDICLAAPLFWKGIDMENVYHDTKSV